MCWCGFVLADGGTDAVGAEGELSFGGVEVALELKRWQEVGVERRFIVIEGRRRFRIVKPEGRGRNGI